MSIKENLNFIQNQINQTAIDSGRSPQEIKLIAVSKTKPIELLREAISAGHITFGENYVQEALDKIINIGSTQKIEWHYLGLLQKNKVKFCPGNFDWIHTINSIGLSKKIEYHCALNNKIISTLAKGVRKDLNEGGTPVVRDRQTRFHSESISFL